MHFLLVHHGDTDGGPLIHKEACLLLGLVTIERMLPLGLGHKTHKTVRAQFRRAAMLVCWLPLGKISMRQRSSMDTESRGQNLSLVQPLEEAPGVRALMAYDFFLLQSNVFQFTKPLPCVRRYLFIVIKINIKQILRSPFRDEKLDLYEFMDTFQTVRAVKWQSRDWGPDWFHSSGSWQTPRQPLSAKLPLDNDHLVQRS